jgi:GntR family transcriptional regulator of vanillate catabolism
VQPGILQKIGKIAIIVFLSGYRLYPKPAKSARILWRLIEARLVLLDTKREFSESPLSQTVKAQLRLRELILEGRLAAGDRISELALVEMLGVSRTPIRMALVRLQEEGLLDAIPSGGFSVKGFTEEEIRDAIEVRGTLEGLSARLAAERGVSAAALGELRDCLEKIDVLLREDHLDIDGFSTYTDLNAYFHRLLRDLPESSVVSRQIERAITFPFASPNSFVMAQALTHEGRDILLIAQQQHHALVDAIESREGARAEALMREHARLAHRNLEAALKNQKTMNTIPGNKLIRRRGLPPGE